MRKTDEWYELAAGEIPKLLVDHMSGWQYTDAGTSTKNRRKLCIGTAQEAAIIWT